MDYRQLNNITIQKKFLIPLIDELMDELNGSKFFSKLDLRSSYLMLRMCDEYVEKTIFKTHYGHYELKLMPFSLTNTLLLFKL